jgi:hypothetical protein
MAPVFKYRLTLVGLVIVLNMYRFLPHAVVLAAPAAEMPCFLLLRHSKFYFTLLGTFFPF